MSALAQIAAAQHTVTGSDRAWTPDSKSPLFKKLSHNQIKLFPQDGTGITSETDYVIYSTAIEKENPDLIQADKLKTKQIHRAAFLAECVQEKELIAIGGTSGKSTITGMVGVMLEELGVSPSVINGGEIKNFDTDKTLGNAKAGNGNTFVIESDESDGSLNQFFPTLALISNISKDHKPLEELIPLFIQFANQTKETLILNQDCSQIRQLDWPQKKQLTYGITQPADVMAKEIQLALTGSSFKVNKVEFKLHVPGEHNISNALGAITLGKSLGFSEQEIAPALEKFQGIKRRLDPIPSSNGQTVFDDFAHNPKKIQASLDTLRPHTKKIIAIFQPHGYGPTRFLFDEFVDVFAQNLRKEDELILLPIFDAGGTATRDISSEDLADAINQKNRFAQTVESREALIKELGNKIQKDETVVVMGARDPSLTDLCNQIAKL